MNEVRRAARSGARLCRILAAISGGALGFAPIELVAAQQASSAVYVRVDTDQTTVITPRVSVQAPVDEATRVDLTYSMDVWSSASIDIRTSASRPVTERRDEINASVSHDFTDSALSLGYRYSYEPDYESHSASLGLSFDFADKSSTLAFGGGVSIDDIGRAGDPNYDRSLQTYTGQTTFTQILDPKTFLQGVYSINYSDGFQSSPYRYIGLGSWNGACGGPLDEAPVQAGYDKLEYCLPENNPDQRTRHALVARVVRALGEQFSTWIAYRFYLDDWELMSHTVTADLHYLPDADTLLALRYRFYLQDAAGHYRASFSRDPRVLSRHYSRDKELSPFTSHRLMLEGEKSWSFNSGEQFRAVLSVGPTFYMYSDFIPYKRIFAVEATLSGVFVL